MNILFLCTGNSCRSIIAEAVFTSMAPTGFSAQSAGSKPAGFIHPQALLVLKDAGFSTDGLSSKSWDNLPQRPDVVITLCADAAKRISSWKMDSQGKMSLQWEKNEAAEPCPLYIDEVIRSHWGMPDPAKVKGSEMTVQTAFIDTLAVLRKRISALITVLKAEPNMDGNKLQTVLDNIATL